MTWLQFIDGLVGHVLSWPVAVAVLVWILRNPLTGLLGRLTDAEVGGQKFHFTDRLKQAEDLADRAAAPIADERHAAAEQPADHLAATGVVIEQSNRLEAAVRSLASAAGLSDDRGPTAMVSARLVRAGIVNSNYAGAVQELVSLRNDVAHGRHVPTREEADRYTQAVREITQVSEMLIERAYPKD